MARQLTQLKSDFDLLFSDPSGGEIDDAQKTRLFNKGIRDLQSETDVYGTIFDQDIQLFPNEYEYPAPSNFKATIDYLDRSNPTNHFKPGTEKDFWRYYKSKINTCADGNRREYDYLLVNANTGTGTIDLMSFSSVTGWTGSGATNLTSDSTESEYALNFDVTAQTSFYVESSSLTALDLTSHENISTLFVTVDLPTVTGITSISLQWGDDSSNFWEVTEDDTFTKFSLSTGKNRLGFAWNGASQTGSPTVGSVNYVRVTFTYSSAVTDTDFKVFKVESKMPKIYKHSYYTPSLVKTNAGVYQSSFTGNDDTTVMDNEHEDLITLRALRWGYWVFEDMEKVKELDKEYKKDLMQMLSDKPSMKAQQSSTYYRRGK